MAIYDLFSRRQRKSGPKSVWPPPVPATLRNQVVFLWHESIGNVRDHYFGHLAMNVYGRIFGTLSKEYGRTDLGRGLDAREALLDFFMNATDDQALDIIDVSFNFIERDTQGYDYRNGLMPSLTASAAINELNQRMSMSGVPYIYAYGRLIPNDSELLFTDVVEPTFTLLRDPRFAGANEELHSAFNHRRHGRNKECLNDCLKAFESTLKSICVIRGWKHPGNATAKGLIELVLNHELIPRFLETQFTALRSVLESGIPTVRNKLSGHGQGPAPVKVPGYFAAYLLHLTTTTILLLVNAERGSS